ncbi:MAG: hypothetical protein Q4A85_00460 [Kingella sp. (in: b-proteobacteria)]|nr:hypothetical protein [Kingella sp. (in: b-proteobacteria)]
MVIIHRQPETLLSRSNWFASIAAITTKCFSGCLIHPPPKAA